MVATGEEGATVVIAEADAAAEVEVEVEVIDELQAARLTVSAAAISRSLRTLTTLRSLQVIADNCGIGSGFLCATCHLAGVDGAAQRVDHPVAGVDLSSDAGFD